MSKCPKKGEPDNYNHEYQILINYNTRKYMPAR